MNKKYLILFIIIFSIDSFSQEKFRFFQKKNQIEEKLSIKESYRYKINFYSAIKSKFLGDYYESIEFFQKWHQEVQFSERFLGIFGPGQN